jgi:hypothetical protein
LNCSGNGGFTLLFLCNLSELQQGSARGFDPWKKGRHTVLALHNDGRTWLDA